LPGVIAGEALSGTVFHRPAARKKSYTKLAFRSVRDYYLGDNDFSHFLYKCSRLLLEWLLIGSLE